MKTITLYRRDFKAIQDESGESFFDDVLRDLGIVTVPDEQINEITLDVEAWITE